MKEQDEYSDKYLIPKDLRSQIKFGAFTIVDVAILVGSVVVWYMIINNLDMGWVINGLLLLFHLFIGLFIIMRTADNPDRARISVMYQALMAQDHLKYKSIDYNTYKKNRDED